MDQIQFNIKNCSACGKDHYALVSKSLEGLLPGGGDYWTICPDSNKPLFITASHRSTLSKVIRPQKSKLLNVDANGTKTTFSGDTIVIEA